MDYRPVDDQADDGIGFNLGKEIVESERWRKDREALDAERRKAGLTITISARRDPQLIADLLAALIRADRRAGVKVDFEHVEYRREKGDWWDAPEVTAWKGHDDCDGLARAAGGHRSAFAACVKNPGGGWHVFLLDEKGNVDDPCVAAGMPQPSAEAYKGAYKAPIALPAKLPLPVFARRIVRRVRGLVAAGSQEPALSTPPELTAEEVEGLESEVEGALADVPEGERDAVRSRVLEELRRAEAAEGLELDEGANVDGFWSSLTKVVGSVASVVVGVVGTPAAGAAVAAATAGVSAAVGKAEDAARKKGPRKPHPKDPRRKDPAALRKEAAAVAKKAPPGSEEQKAALAVVYVTDPRNVAKVRKRLKVPLKTDPNPADRARLLAALAALDALKYRTPLQDDKDARQAQTVTVNVNTAPAPAGDQDDGEEEEAYEVEQIPAEQLFELADAEDDSWLEEVLNAPVAGCLGTCEIRNG